MKQGKITALLLATMLGLSACGTSGRADLSRFPSVRQLDLPASAAAPVLEPEANTGITALGVELLRRVRDGSGGVVVSPLSAAMALSMTANGAAGDTRTAFEQVLGADVEALNANAAQLMADYAALGGSTRAAMANSLWADGSMTFYDSFLADCAGYKPGMFTADLSSDEARQAVNAWVSGETGGMIGELLRENLSPEVAALLINAVYLDMTWEREFDGSRTRKGSFSPTDGSRMEVSYMRQTGNLPYFTMDGGAGAVLPFDDGRLAFAAILPDGTLDGFLEDLDGAALSAAIAGASSETAVNLTMPKFTARWDGELGGPLCALGLEEAFDPDRADLSRLGHSPNGRPYVSRVLQAVMLEVDEKGSRAAAATSVEVAASGAPVFNGVELTLDRPFLYAVWDTQAGIPLFLGTFEGL